MRKFLFIAFVAVCGIAQLKAQTAEGTAGGYHLYTGIYYNNFTQGDLHDLQSSFNSFPTGSQETTQFPDFIAFDFGVLRDVGTLQVGVFGGYQSTGARNFYSDFSGYLKTEFIVEAYTFGAVGNYKLNDARFKLLAALGMAINKVRIEQELSIFEESDILFGKYTSENLVVQLGVEYQILTKNPSISAVALFDISEFGGDLRLTNRSNEWPDDSTIPFKVDWTGFKLGLRIGFDISK